MKLTFEICTHGGSHVTNPELGAGFSYTHRAAITYPRSAFLVFCKWPLGRSKHLPRIIQESFL